MKLDRVTIAVTDMDRMIAFYNAVFAANLEPVVLIDGHQLYRGQLAGLELILCPNEIAGVVAERNRQQLRFQVDDIEAVMVAGKANHGTEVTAIDEHGGNKMSSLADPEGNTIEFIELQ